MARYFLDFRAGHSLSIDEEGEELPDMDEAHELAVATLAEAIKTAIVEGGPNQRFSVEVRDEIGPVLRVSAVLESAILRKQ